MKQPKKELYAEEARYVLIEPMFPSGFKGLRAIAAALAGIALILVLIMPNTKVIVSIIGILIFFVVIFILIGLVNLLKILKSLNKELKQAKIKPHSKKYKIIIAATTLILFAAMFYLFRLNDRNQISDTTLFLIIIASITFIILFRYILIKIFKVEDVQETDYGKYLKKKFANRE